MQKERRPFLVGIGGAAGSVPAAKRFVAALGQSSDLSILLAIKPDTHSSQSIADALRSATQIPVIEASPGDYLVYLRESPEEAQFLMRDLLIGVTSFFRDAAAFDALGQLALRPLIKSATGPLRFWVPGCGTGQEAYSLAILATEIMDELGKWPELQIFATDLDTRALQIARRGIYTKDIVTEVSPHRLERFFERAGHRYQVGRDVRKLVVFSPHNLISDAPFSRINLISCRNLLIYLGPHLQKKLMAIFHYALEEGGYLFLGSSESVAGHSELFRVADSKHRIAQRKATGAKRHLPRNTGHSANMHVTHPQANEEADLGLLSQRILLEEFAPPYAIVNQDAQVIYLSPRIGGFLQPPEGEFSTTA